MSLLQNAIQAIECGLEDFEVGSDARLKSAVRNVYAGVLLLFKAKLSEISPVDSDEVLLKEEIVPSMVDGDITWKGKGKKTVDFRQIEERFRNLGISVDWTSLKVINRLRNDVEHYFTTVNAKSIREAIAKSFGIASDFLLNHLSLDPKSQFSSKSWEIFIDVAEVYEQERAHCLSTHHRLDTASNYVMEHASEMSCDKCGSDLINVLHDGSAECRACSRTWDPQGIVVGIIRETSFGDIYMAVKDGGEPTIGQCPECFENALVVCEMACAVCGERQASRCWRCESQLRVDEIDGSGCCGYCSHVMSKDN